MGPRVSSQKGWFVVWKLHVSAFATFSLWGRGRFGLQAVAKAWEVRKRCLKKVWGDSVGGALAYVEALGVIDCKDRT